MKKHTISGWVLAAALLNLNSVNADTVSSTKLQHGEYRDWRVLGVSLRHEKNSMRAIVGNDIAIQAARVDKVKPWPDGTIIAKIKWAEIKHPNWNQASVSGEFTAAEAMVKNSQKYPETGGWGFGIWYLGRRNAKNARQGKIRALLCMSFTHERQRLRVYLAEFAIKPSVLF